MAIFGKKRTYALELVGGPRDGERFASGRGSPTLRVAPSAAVIAAAFDLSRPARELVYVRRPGQSGADGCLMYDFFGYADTGD